MLAELLHGCLARIRLHPIKSLDPVEVIGARIGPNGGLELDRAWALYSAGGRAGATWSRSAWINGKRTPLVHFLRAEFAPNLSSVTLSSEARERPLAPVKLAFPAATQAASAWFSDYFGERVTVRSAPEGFPDDELAPGPTIVSTASLEAVCEWFPGMTLEEARVRFRTTLEIGGVPAFWEDRLFGADAHTTVRFRIGDVLLEGSNPCARCVVPPRNPRTAFSLDGFPKRFAELRKARLPAWAPAARFDHFYRFAANTRVPASERGKLLRLGDRLQLL